MIRPQKNSFIQEFVPNYTLDAISGKQKQPKRCRKAKGSTAFWHLQITNFSQNLNFFKSNPSFGPFSSRESGAKFKL